MRKRSARNKNHSNAFGIALFVGALVGLLVLAAVVIRIILVFHQSTYDGKHQYILSVKEPNKTEIIAFNPDTQTIHSLIINGNVDSNPESKFLIPIDSTAISSEDLSLSDITTTLVFHGGKMRTTMTPVDAVSLLFFYHTVDSENISSQTVSLDEMTSKKSNLSKLFLNETLYKEGKSIAIVNATDVSGLGTTVATLMSNIGGNVVSITTADKSSETSSVAYTGDLSYTASHLARVLHMPLIHLPGITISDITITLGKDSISLFQ